ncbi:hypothetical protein [Haematobacter massiliensis]|uniref:hypothetical protein n=1 Tax=Haematobacter massiliensis TaxID=195105 RepID=UPI0010394BCA|nr:hypothetical protein [Haematobacter massiliensis]QBJ25202.1 hypothetical protein HmaOT1_13670 [Haematobacter massiliensis]
MSINSKTLLGLLKEVAASDEIGGKTYCSRYALEPWEGDGVFGIGQRENRPELRERDRHIIYAKQQNLLTLEVMRIGRSEDFFGGFVSLTPLGVKYLEEKSKSWWQAQINGLTANVLTIFVSVVAALLSAWLLRLTGLEK